MSEETLELFQNREYKEISKKHLYNIISFLLKEGIEFSIIAYSKFIEFNPKIPKEIMEFDEITMFAIANYTFESATIDRDFLYFEAGFGIENYGSNLKVPLEAIIQVIVDESVVAINYYEPKETIQEKNSMEALLNNPENLKLLKRKKGKK